jgi:precorrin-3B C17-methyltransferase
MSNGKIFLVGLGPGSESHMSVRAREAIAQSDTIIGYSTYIKLVKDLVDGKEVIRKGMTEELDRCYEALERAQQGKIVSLISSGDTGIYGMAGPTYEVLLQAGWKPGNGIDVEVVPGSSAINSCAALVGAPLTHDFCSISLSDLLTPWPVIARRLEAAARADFVVALYNPKSGRRTQQIVEAQRIMLLHRRADTPVALVKSAYRPRQNIQFTTLDHMADQDIGMLTTVLIGNSHTFLREGLMVTPRGYANKYETVGGEVRSGEQAGRSLSMGLLGWKSYVRSYLRDNPEITLNEVARHFDAPVGEILSAIAEANNDDDAGIYQAVAVAPSQQDKALELARQWGKLRGVARSSNDVVVEMLFSGADLERKGERLNVINDHFHLHIPWYKVHQAWFTGRDNRLHGVYFLDEQRTPVFSLLLRTQDRPFDRKALAQHIELIDHQPAYIETEAANDE